MTELTEQRLKRALAFITDHYRTYRTGCTVRAILAHFEGEVTSTNTIVKWLDKLEQNGDITRTPGMSGAIIPANDPLLEEVEVMREALKNIADSVHIMSTAGVIALDAFDRLKEIRGE